MKKPVLNFIVVCMFISSFALNSSASPKKINRYSVPRISGKITNLSNKKLQLLSQDFESLNKDSAKKKDRSNPEYFPGRNRKGIYFKNRPQ
jgi:hypothetical protein